MSFFEVIMFVILGVILLYVGARVISLAYFRSKRDFVNEFTRGEEHHGKQSEKKEGRKEDGGLCL